VTPGLLPHRLPQGVEPLLPGAVVAPLRGCLETKPLYEKKLCHVQGKDKNRLTGQSVS
jgi:hypothetical protein